MWLNDAAFETHADDAFSFGHIPMIECAKYARRRKFRTPLNACRLAGIRFIPTHNCAHNCRCGLSLLWDSGRVTSLTERWTQINCVQVLGSGIRRQARVRACAKIDECALTINVIVCLYVKCDVCWHQSCNAPQCKHTCVFYG